MADTTPTLPLAGGALELSGARPVLLVDPAERLLRGVLDALVDAAPAVAAPTVGTLRSEAAAREDPSTGSLDLPHPVPESFPHLRVAAREPVLDAVFDGFHAASRVAAFLEADALSLTSVEEHEPSTLLIADGAVAVPLPAADAAGYAAVRETDPERVDEVRGRWETRLTGAESYAPRTPSRRVLFGAFAGRCDANVAAELLRLLDALPEVDRGDPCDHLDCVYAAGARHGAVNYGLRRAAEDCGLASPATLSSVKAEFEDAGLIDTEPVPRRVGRPRQRVVPADDRLTSAATEEVPAVVAAATAGMDSAENTDGAE
ncbi:transcriptional regulator TbsP domain-containing protein [Haloparvum sedimenti]|uniref:transcriptional regulator TbsP domain-containing protein n=1 Tax=Haloparvum sedimenti TaxID=1678448 RepID=UPI00071E729A|nr:DUF5821 family protein [Haloparvum sedimenti]